MKKLFFILSFLPFCGFAADKAIILERSRIYGMGETYAVVGTKPGTNEVSFWLDHTICTGSGSCSLTSMSGYTSGDRALITKGSYSSLTIENLTGISVVNKDSLVTVTGQLTVNNLTNVLISGAYAVGAPYGCGLYFTGTSSTTVNTSGSIYSTTFQSLYAYGTNQVVFDLSNNGDSYTYDGTNISTFYSYKMTITGCRFVKTNQVVQGAFSNDFTDLNDSLSYTYNYSDSTYGNGNIVAGNGMFGMIVQHNTFLHNYWFVSGSAMDVGVIQYEGDADIGWNYSAYGYGWFTRQNGGLSLNGRSITRVHDNIHIAHKKYGFYDYRIVETDTTTGTTSPYLRGSSCWIYNNTSGNLDDTTSTGQYTCPLLVFYGMNGHFAAAGYTVRMFNNLVFNTVITYAGTHFMYKAFTDDITDSAGNFYFSDPIAAGIMTDTINCLLKSTAYIISRGSATLYSSTAYNGARNSPIPGATVLPATGCNCTWTKRGWKRIYSTN